MEECSDNSDFSDNAFSVSIDESTTEKGTDTEHLDISISLRSPNLDTVFRTEICAIVIAL